MKKCGNYKKYHSQVSNSFTKQKIETKVLWRTKLESIVHTKGVQNYREYLLVTIKSKSQVNEAESIGNISRIWWSAWPHSIALSVRTITSSHCPKPRKNWTRLTWRVVLAERVRNVM